MKPRSVAKSILCSVNRALWGRGDLRRNSRTLTPENRPGLTTLFGMGWSVVGPVLSNTSSDKEVLRHD